VVTRLTVLIQVKMLLPQMTDENKRPAISLIWQSQYLQMSLL